MLGKLGYSHVKVHVDGEVHRMDDDASLELQLDRENGWRLWRHYDDGIKLVAGEYESDLFAVTVKDMVICITTDDETFLDPDPEQEMRGG